MTTKIVEVEPYKTRPKYQHIKNDVDHKNETRRKPINIQLNFDDSNEKSNNPAKFKIITHREAGQTISQRSSKVTNNTNITNDIVKEVDKSQLHEDNYNAREDKISMLLNRRDSRQN